MLLNAVFIFHFICKSRGFSAEETNGVRQTASNGNHLCQWLSFSMAVMAEPGLLYIQGSAPPASLCLMQPLAHNLSHRILKGSSCFCSFPALIGNVEEAC